MSCVSVRLRVFSILVLMCCFPVASQAQVFLWAKATQGSSYTWEPSLACDGHKNLTLLGETQNPLQIYKNGPRQAGSGAFLAKVDSSGHLLWQSFLGTGGITQPVSHIVIDRFGATYFLIYTDPIIPTTIGTFNIPRKNVDETLLVKADSNGGVMWVRECQEITLYDTSFNNLKGPHNNLSLALDSEDHLYVTTDFVGDLLVNGASVLHSDRALSTALSEYDLDGNLAWQKVVFSQNDSIQRFIYNWVGKRSLVTGLRSGCVIAENFIDSSFVGNARYFGLYESTLLTRFSSAGAINWTLKPISGLISTLGIGADSVDNCYVRIFGAQSCGYSGGSLDLGTGGEGLMQVSPMGVVHWLKQTLVCWDDLHALASSNTWYWSQGQNFAVDAGGNSISGGTFYDSAVSPQFRVYSPNAYGSYFTAYGRDGSFSWVQQCPGVAECLISDNSSGLFASGLLLKDGYFGTTKLLVGNGGAYLGRIGDADRFAKILQRTSYCAGDTLQYRFTITQAFDTANRYSVELSKPDGRFPGTVIGTSTGNTDTLPIYCTIPLSSVYSTAYRLRLNVSSADAHGVEYTQRFTIHPLPPVAIIVRKPLRFCDGGSTDLAASGATDYRWSTGDTGRFVTVSTAGWVKLAGIDSDGCASVDSVLVQVKAVPKVTISAGGPTTFCEGGSVTLTATGGVAYNWSNNSSSRSITVTESGVYQVDGAGFDTCVGTSNAITVTVLPRPAVPTISHNGFTLISSADSNNQWLYWGKPITGATGKEYLATQPGQYSVVVTNANGCSTGSAQFTLGSDAVLLDDSPPNALSLAPDPVTSTGTVRYSLARSGMVSITISDLLGRTIVTLLHETVGAGRHSFMANEALAHLPSGTYYLRMESPAATLTSRFVKVE